MPETSKRSLSTAKIVFLVVAAAAPLVAMAGTVPLSIGIGNGVGVPGTYLIATVTLLLFAVGYAAMARIVTRGGGFYTYVAEGLGRPAAAAGAVFAMVAYNALVAALAGGVGYFLTSGLGLPLPWWVCSLAGVALMAFLGYRRIDLSARLLMVLIIAEIVVLSVFDIAVMIELGGRAFTWSSFSPHEIFSGAPGVALMFAFGSFFGFEAAALYAEESKDPARTVPRATYAAVLVIGGFYLFTSWMMIGAIGADRAREQAADHSGELFLDLSADKLGDIASALFGLMVITSVFASLLSAHNATSRYLLTMGRDGLLPSALGRTHPTYGSPYVASRAQAVLIAVVVAVFAVLGLDPYRQLVSVMSGLSTLGIILLQTLASVAIVVFFRRRRDPRVFATIVAPVLACVGMALATYFLFANFDVLADSHNPVMLSMPWVVLALGVIAALYVARLARTSPERYRRLGNAIDSSTSLEGVTQ
ncbi:APC family permease [Gordonia jinhuaensis]|uniref:Amino acid permease n=1 Tax=Gordonia jinhuaensis TaxID=1517702 RepID=A0A916TBL8_9ACTN|nr:APC family permease [Gordonia jinhuaensis]GGB38723.1 amino acid permease [Gordonia jinhuaensis]